MTGLADDYQRILQKLREENRTISDNHTRILNCKSQSTIFSMQNKDYNNGNQRKSSALSALLTKPLFQASNPHSITSARNGHISSRKNIPRKRKTEDSQDDKQNWLHEPQLLSTFADVKSETNDSSQVQQFGNVLASLDRHFIESSKQVESFDPINTAIDTSIQNYLSNWLHAFYQVASTTNKSGPSLYQQSGKDNLLHVAAAAQLSQYTIAAAAAFQHMMKHKDEPVKSECKKSTISNSFPIIQRMLSALELHEDQIENHTNCATNGLHIVKKEYLQSVCKKTDMRNNPAKSTLMNRYSVHCGATIPYDTSSNIDRKQTQENNTSVENEWCSSYFQTKNIENSDGAVDLSLRGQCTQRKRARNSSSNLNLTSSTFDIMPSVSIRHDITKNEIQRGLPANVAKLKEWLLELLSLSLLNMKSVDIDNISNRISIIKKCWHHLFITYLIENKFDLKSNNEDQTHPFTISEYEFNQLNTLVTKGCDFRIDGQVFKLMRKIIIFKEARMQCDNPSLQTAEKEIQSQLRNHFVSSQTNEIDSRSYSRFMMLFRRLFNAQCTHVLAIFWNNQISDECLAIEEWNRYIECQLKEFDRNT